MIHSRQIDAFQAVMLAGGMTAAAEILHVTQPAVSRLVRDLERATRLTLFQRHANRIVPTAQAYALLDEVKRSFVGLTRIEQFAEELRSGPRGLLRIVALPAMAGFMSRLVARFCRDRPRLGIVIDSMASPLIRERVAEGVFDLGVCAAPFRSAGLASTALEDNVVAVLPAAHPVARRGVIQLSDLSGQDVIVIDKFASGQHPLELAMQGMSFGRVLRTPLSMIACTLAAEGAGITIVDPFSASEFVGRGVVLRRFVPDTLAGAALIWPKARSLSAVAQEFHDDFVADTRAFTEQTTYLQP